jgi:biotin transporter BioY
VYDAQNVTKRTVSLVIIGFGAVLVVIVWWMDIQLPMQSVPTTTEVVNTVTLTLNQYIVNTVFDCM